MNKNKTKVHRDGEEGREVLSAEVTLGQYLNKVTGRAKYGVGFRHSRLNTCEASGVETRSRTARRPARPGRDEGSGEARGAGQAGTCRPRGGPRIRNPGLRLLSSPLCP